MVVKDLDLLVTDMVDRHKPGQTLSQKKIQVYTKYINKKKRIC